MKPNPKVHDVSVGVIPNCKECRRLKIKCSKTIPCDQCVRRGVQDICPNGQIASGKAARTLLASSLKANEELQLLRDRIRKLEEGLDAAYKELSDDIHPLLEPALLSIAKPPIEEDLVSAEDLMISTFGTMRLDESGHRWLGATALSEMYLNMHDEDTDFEPLNPEKVKLALPASALFSPEALLIIALDNLPPKTEAWSLIESFYEYSTYAFCVIPRERMIATIFNLAYGPNRLTMSAYQLSSLYSMLCLGGLHDLSRQIYAPETREWMEVAQSLLFVMFGQWNDSLDAIEAVFLQALVLPSRSELELNKTYYYTAWSMKMAQSIGLHRDQRQLGLSEAESSRRRQLFSELCLMDASESLHFGRPLTMPRRYYDQTALNDDHESKFVTFKRNLVFVMQEISDLFTSTLFTGSYATVSQIDKTLRGISLPINLVDKEVEEDTNYHLQLFMSTIWCDSLLLSLHRTYYVHAARKASEDPFLGRFKISIITSYEAASSMVKNSMSFVNKYPQLLPRLALVWPHLFTSVVVLYSFAFYMPFWDNALASAQLGDSALNGLFANSDCVRAKKALPFLIRLQSSAFSSLQAYRSKVWHHPNSKKSRAETSQHSLPGLASGTTLFVTNEPETAPIPSGSTGRFGSRSYAFGILQGTIPSTSNPEDYISQPVLDFDFPSSDDLLIDLGLPLWEMVWPMSSSDILFNPSTEQAPAAAAQSWGDFMPQL